MNKNLDLSVKGIQQNFEDNFSRLLPIFYEMQSTFLSGIYKRYGDLEGGQIVIYFARDLHLRLMRKREEDLWVPGTPAFAFSKLLLTPKS